MPQTPHIEHHFTASETVRDIVIGMSDGLTVPFALAAGLSGAVNSTGVIITAGPVSTQDAAIDQVVYRIHDRHLHIDELVIITNGVRTS